MAPSLPELCCCPCHLHSPAWYCPRQGRAVPAPNSAVPGGAAAALVQPAAGCRGRGGVLIQQFWLSGAAADGTGGVSTGLWRCPMMPTRTPGRGCLEGAGRAAEKLSGHPGQGQHGLQCLPARGPQLSGEIREGQTRQTSRDKTQPQRFEAPALLHLSAQRKSFFLWKGPELL